MQKIDDSKLNKYIGIPFENGGRTFKSCDCWGLCQLFYRHELKFILPEYKIDCEDFDAINKQILFVVNGGSYNFFTKLDKPIVHCIVLMRLGACKGLNHAAIWLGNNRILQAYEGTGSHIVQADNISWRNLIKGFIIPTSYLERGT